MLLIKAKVGPSAIMGRGLFADEFIPKGKIIWKFSPNVDEAYTHEEIEQLPQKKRSEVLSLYHSNISKQTGRYIYPGDDSKYINHSATPNVGTRFDPSVEEDISFATKDIKPGEEITINYETFAQEGTNFQTK